MKMNDDMQTMNMMMVVPIQAFLFSSQNCLRVYVSDDLRTLPKDGSTRVLSAFLAKSSLYWSPPSPSRRRPSASLSSGRSLLSEYC